MRYKLTVPYTEIVHDEKRENSNTFDVEAGSENEAVAEVLENFEKNMCNSEAPRPRKPGIKKSQ